MDDYQKWLKETFINGTEAESLLLFIRIKFTEHAKFAQFSELLDNMFYTPYNHEVIINAFSKIQRTINAVNLVKHAFRFKRARIYNTDDLYMNPISPTDKFAVVVLQNNTKYVFHIRELIQAVKSSLSNCCNFFADPIVCKNPYTNIPFSKSALYNIYFAIKGSTYLMPTLFHRYFLCNFDYSEFSIDNDDMINEEYLKTYVENYCLDNVYSHVKDMFTINNMKCNIHKSFPKNKLFKIMKPYLKLYFASSFSINSQKKEVAFKLLHKKMHAFIKFNPNFGKRKVKLVEIRPFSNIRSCNYYLDEKVVPFVQDAECEKHVTSFMTSHLEDCSHNTSPSSSSSSPRSGEEYEYHISYAHPEDEYIDNSDDESHHTPVLYDEDDETNNDSGDDIDDEMYDGPV